MTAFAALDEAGRESFARDRIALVNTDNEATDGTLKTSSEYLEVVAIKR